MDNNYKDIIQFELNVQKILLTWNNLNYCNLCRNLNLEYLKGNLCKRSREECKLMWARIFAEHELERCPNIYELERIELSKEFTLNH